MTARERLKEWIAAEPRGSVLSLARINDVLLALDAAEEMCDERSYWRWWRDQDPTGGGFEDSAHACGQLAAAIRALREEVSI